MLLTVDDVTRRGHYRNAYRTFGRLLELGVVPIVNENDTVATHEIRFGDNDRLAALVAHLVHADALILLSDVDALYTDAPAAARAPDDSPTCTARTIWPAIDVSTRGHGGRHRRHDHQGRRGPDRHLGRDPDGAGRGRAGGGGPRRRAGRHALPPDRPASARPGSSGSGTPATPAASWCWTPAPSGRWSTRNASLLPAGVTAVRGQFTAGEAVNLVDPDGTVVARGLVNFDADELPGSARQDHRPDRRGARQRLRPHGRAPRRPGLDRRRGPIGGRVSLSSRSFVPSMRRQPSLRCTLVTNSASPVRIGLLRHGRRVERSVGDESLRPEANQATDRAADRVQRKSAESADDEGRQR